MFAAPGAPAGSEYVPELKVAVVPLTSEAVPLPLEGAGAVTSRMLVALKSQRAILVAGVANRLKVATLLVV